MNERVMMFGAVILAIIAIVLGGYSFGEVRSLSDMAETQQARIDALEAVQEEDPAPDDEAMDQVQAEVDRLSAEIADLNQRLDQIVEAFEVDGEPDAADEPVAGEEETQE